MLSKSFILKKIKRVLLHLFFWLLVLLFYTYVFDVDNKIYSNVFYFSLFLLPSVMGTTYFTIYTLIPNYLITQRYFLFALYGVYTLIISLFSILFSIFFSHAYLTNFDFDDMNPVSRNVFFTLSCIYLVVIVVSAFKLLKLNFDKAIQNNMLESKMFQTQLKLKENELNYLKMQIHPHFLFNTLNTMYAFALKKADETPSMILQLSNLLDYLLHQTDKPFVNLKDEIDHIKDYISLEKLRFNNRLEVHIREQFLENEVKIRPMVLLPFVENSFKHGKIENGILRIDISIESNQQNILFIIKNKMQSEDTSDKEMIQNSSNGIGLVNIKKRLEILYKDAYSLKIKTNNDVFEVDLMVVNETYD